MRFFLSIYTTLPLAAFSVSISQQNLKRNGERNMFRKKSDYALNKLDPDAIVYRDATGEIHRLTRVDFDSEEDFLRWKKWSDENYHAAEKKETIESQRTIPFSAVYPKRASPRYRQKRRFLRQKEKLNGKKP